MSLANVFTAGTKQGIKALEFRCELGGILGAFLQCQDEISCKSGSF